jgi:RNA polymerase sigma-70 factor (ECF subfamily)
LKDPGGRRTLDATDEELMRRFQAGETRAFEVLLRRHRTAAFQFILRFVGNRARAEDVLQETWLKVVRSAPQYEPRARFTTWLFTIARNLCVDLQRREVLRSMETLDGAEDGERPLGDGIADGGASDPERAAHAARIRPAIEAALAGLPAEQREVFVLREYAGLAFKDIAEATRTPENTVKSRMRYALEGLRRALTGAGIDGDLADDAATRAAVR